MYKSTVQNVSGKNLMIFSFYCVLVLCILSHLILTTLGDWQSYFHFTV